MRTAIITTPGANKLTRLYKDYHQIFDLYNYDDIVIRIQNDSIDISFDGTDINAYSTIILRAPGYDLELTMAIAKYAKNNGIKIINSFMENFIHGYKLFQTIKAQQMGTKVPKSLYIPTKSILKKKDLIAEELNLPLIMKVVDGQAGRSNFLINDVEDIEKHYKKGSRYIFQEFIPNKFDYRVFVLNYKVISIKKRIRKSNESHRNNLTVGGSAEYIENWKNNPAYTQIIKLSEELSRNFMVELAGIDFIVDEKNNIPYFLEINVTPGFGYDSIDEGILVNFIKDPDRDHE